MRRIAVLDAPSNLGLRPPTATSVPGCAKAPGALRDHGLLTRLGARDAGCLTPPRYDPGDWRPGDGVAHAAQIAAYSRALADRIGGILDAGEFPVVLGGDCSILLGSGIAMNRLGEAVGGRIGLVFVDGHSDFRHPGNASYVGAAAGEDLALATGRGQPDLAAIEGRRPYFRDIDVVVLGIRAQDEYRLDLQAAGIVTRPVPALRAEGAARSAQWARDQLVDCAGFWLHVDVDVLDPAVMPAVDAPSPGGIAFPELELLLAGLVESPHCLGVEITVYDPDYDPDGAYAAEITSTVATGLAAARTVAPRPDLVAARADLAGAPARTTEGGTSPLTSEPASSAPASGAPSDAASVAPPEPVAAAPVTRPARKPAPVSRLSRLNRPARKSAPATSETAEPEATERTPAAPEAAGRVPAAPEATERAAAAPKAAPAASAVPEAAEPAPAAPEASERAAAAPKAAPAASAVPEAAEPAPAAPEVAAPALDEPVAEAEPPVAEAEPETAGEPPVAQPPVAGRSTEDEPVRRPPRPLGQAPLLDSEPLPATRPGMLRPRPSANGSHPGDRPAAGGFSLPVQRPAFDVGSGEPADIA